MADVDVKLPPFERLALDFQTLVPKVVFQESVRCFVKIRSFYLFQFERYISKLRDGQFICLSSLYDYGLFSW